MHKGSEPSLRRSESTIEKSMSIIPWVTGVYLDPTSYCETCLKRGAMMTNATKPAELPFATRVTPPKALFDYIRIDNYLRYCIIRN